MRILHIEWSEAWGGQERRVFGELTGMKERGHSVGLAARAHSCICKEARQAGIPVSTLGMRRALDPASILRLQGILRREGVQILNTHSGIDSWIGGLAAKLARTPALIRTRHLDLPLRRNWVNFVHYLPDRIVTCGENMRQALITAGHFPEKQIVSIPTGIDFEQFRPNAPRDETRAALGVGPGDLLVLMVGVLRGVKSYDVALQAFSQAIARARQARLAIAGEGPMRPGIEKMVHDLGLESKVRLLGYRSDVANLMAAADIFLLTSRSEGVPQVAVQALGLGLPVIATRVGGLPELIEPEKTGLLVPAGDVRAVANGILSLARDPGMGRAWGRAASPGVRSRYSRKAMLDQTEQLYATLLAPRESESR